MGKKFELSNLLRGLVLVDTAHRAFVWDVAQDSRKVKEGTLFLASPGQRVDGRDFIFAAIEQGAGAILYENSDGYLIPDAARAKIPLIGVPNLNVLIGLIAARFYQDPSRHMTVIGVTGTNGKTSITQFIAQVLTAYHRRCAVIGTIGKGFLPNLHATGYTTPDAIALQRDLAECLSQHADSVAMEVSSHSLSQHRVASVEFDIAVLTNLTRDHLDYHGTMAAYGAAKATLFQYPSIQYAVYNGDDAFGRELLTQHPPWAQALVYTTHPKPKFNCPTIAALRIMPTERGVIIDVRTPWGTGQVHSTLLGHFNVSNLLAALCVAGALEMPLPECLRALENLRPVNGRMQSFGGANGKPQVIVDYAHSPDALEQVLTSLRQHRPKKLWCVFGCGGDRDRGKRPQMGEIAARHSDYVVITSDNPRSEKPEQIAAEIRAGIPSGSAVHVELDRAAAIAFALRSAESGDIVLIAGKGHETGQIIGNNVIPFNDSETVQKILTAW